MKKGFFITLEGGEGGGKSTLSQALAASFAKAGLQLDHTREPGGTTGAESIRKVLVEGSADQWDATTETILFIAARVDHVRKRILPALKSGTHVLCDRFADSTLVYQGYAKGLGEEFLSLLHNFCLGNLQPDLTLILDIAPETGLKRAAMRKGTENRFEGMDLSFHKAVREGFLRVARENPRRCAVLDATLPPAEVHASALAAIREKLGIKL